MICYKLVQVITTKIESILEIKIYVRQGIMHVSQTYMSGCAQIIIIEVWHSEEPNGERTNILEINSQQCSIYEIKLNFEMNVSFAKFWHSVYKYCYSIHGREENGS